MIKDETFSERSNKVVDGGYELQDPEFHPARFVNARFPDGMCLYVSASFCGSIRGVIVVLVCP